MLFIVPLFKMKIECKDCGAMIEAPIYAEEGEIIGCTDCGLDYIVRKKDGVTLLEELTIEGEDWGE